MCYPLRCSLLFYHSWMPGLPCAPPCSVLWGLADRTRQDRVLTRYMVTMAFVLPSRLYGLLLILHFFYFPFQLISSKVPKAEYVPTIIRRDDPSIIPILYVSVTPLLRLHVWEQA